MSANQRGLDPTRSAHLIAIDENPYVPAQLAGLVPDLESEARVSLLERVEESFQRRCVDLFAFPRAEVAEPPVKADLEHTRELARGRKEIGAGIHCMLRARPPLGPAGVVLKPGVERSKSRCRP